MDKLLQIRVTYFTLKNYFASLIKRKSAVKKEGKRIKEKEKEKRKKKSVKHECSSPFRGTNAKL